MLRSNVRKKCSGAVLCVIALFLTATPAFAAGPHENPETAEAVFSGISLLGYYSESLDYVLYRDPSGVEARIDKIPFANIPQSLEETTAGFASSAIGISHLVVTIDTQLDEIRIMVKQYRVDEVSELAAITSDHLSQANSELELIEQAVKSAGTEIKVFSAPPQSELRRSYDGTLARVSRIREMLTLYRDLLTDLLKEPDAIRTSLDPASITLEVDSAAAFVGDSIRFKGNLTSRSTPLAGREVDILLNKSYHLTVITDARGNYQGIMKIPYWYIPELYVQALYYPRNKDSGVYFASISPVIKMELLFCEVDLDINVEEKAFPGLETTVTGSFDYGQYPPPGQREAEIYFDDTLIAEFNLPETFTRKIKIDPETDTGEHIITLSSAAAGRYASANARVILNITKAKPILDISLPGIAVIPGNISLQGRLYSEIGPLDKASIEIGMGNSRSELTSSGDGTFTTKTGAGMSFGAVGSQDMVINVTPNEPWHSAFSTTRSILMVNVINCGVLLALLLLLGIYLPGRLKKLGLYPGSTGKPGLEADLSKTAAVYSDGGAALTLTAESDNTGGSPRNIILRWYRLLVKIIEPITRGMLGPHNTLREFAQESGRMLGPAARYFIEFTRMVEKLLYSQYTPTEQDVESSRQLSSTIEAAARLAVTTPPTASGQPGDGEMETRFEHYEHRSGNSPQAFGAGHEPETSQLRRMDVWLWILVFLSIVWYASLLLFLLPLLAVSLSSCLPLMIVDDSTSKETITAAEERNQG